MLRCLRVRPFKCLTSANLTFDSVVRSRQAPAYRLVEHQGSGLQLLMRRLTNKDIFSLLAISERTVKFHVSNILSKLQVDDRRGLSPDKLALKDFVS
jgi:DNA-binding NarL/FixJ family response regulator